MRQSGPTRVTTRRRLLRDLGLGSGGVALAMLAACAAPAAPTATPAAAPAKPTEAPKPAEPTKPAAAAPANTPAPAATKPAAAPTTAPEATKPAAVPAAAAPAKPTAGGRIVQSVFAVTTHEEFYKKKIPEFTEKNPGTTVETKYYSFPDFMQKFEVELAAGTGPDVIFSNPAINFPTVASKGLMVSLEPYLKRDNYSLADYVEQAVEWLRWKGELYALPQNMHSGAGGLFYNKDMFDAGGVAYPTDSWTIDDLTKAAEKLSKAGQFGYLAPASSAYVINNTWVRLFQGRWHDAEGKKSTLTSQEVVDANVWVADLLKRKLAPLANELGNAYWGQLFAGNKLAMAIDGIWAVGLVKGSADKSGTKWAVAELPKGPKGTRLSGGGATEGFGINKTSKAPDAAWEYIKFLSTKEYSRAFAAAKLLPPVYKSLVKDPELVSDPILAPFYKAFDYFDGPGVRPANLRVTQAVATITSSLEPIWLGRTGAKEGLAEADKKLQALLDEPMA